MFLGAGFYQGLRRLRGSDTLAIERYVMEVMSMTWTCAPIVLPDGWFDSSAHVDDSKIFENFFSNRSQSLLRSERIFNAKKTSLCRV